jgi:hypothetical protein
MTAIPQPLQCLLGQEERRLHIERDDLLELLGGDLVDQAEQAHASVVDEDVLITA